MIIVDKVRFDKYTKTSVIYQKYNTKLIISDIPPLPEDTVLDIDAKGDLYVVDYYGKKYKKKNLIESVKFYHLTKNFLTFDQYVRVVNQFPYNAAEKFMENPFFLLSLELPDSSLNFNDIDKNITIKTFEQRTFEIREAINFVLNLSADHGNTWLPYKELEDKVKTLLSKNGHELDRGEVSSYLNYWKKFFHFSEDNFNNNTLVTTPELYRTEKFIFNTINKYKNITSPYKDFKFVKNPDLSDRQNNSIEQLLKCNGTFVTLTGGPGTGKTTILKEILSQFLENYPTYPVQVISPTGRAAKRVKEVLGDLNVNVSTMHRFLNIDAEGHVTDVSDNTLDRTKSIRLLIIEESSMVDLPIFKMLLDSLDLIELKVILVGDINQLPSVGAGDLLRDLIDLGIHVERLTESFRFVGTIAENAEKINNNDPTLSESDTFEIIRAENADILNHVSTIDADCFITPYRNESRIISTNIINNIIQNKRCALAPIIPNNSKFRVGDSIIFVKTSYNKRKKEDNSYFNGETGTILSYDRTTGEYTIAIDDERVIKTAKSEDFDLGYAITIHKSQGSEYPHVCIVLPEFSSFISRKMLYTAVTRAKQKVTLITTPEVLKKVIENNADINRRTILQELIKKNIK